MLHNKKYRGWFAGLIAISLLNDCAMTGLSQIPQTRDNYNKAIETSENEQFLQNIVQMHYAMGGYFLAIDSITTQSTLTSRVQAQIFSDPTAVNIPPFWAVTPSVEYIANQQINTPLIQQ